mmetsp:Transcript_61937/g.146677  ORF Transcript_61937/g.146677 Transcript_61937/m.146677 type:complete len:167 (+) Transcript_61937:1051-1551(+)
MATALSLASLAPMATLTLQFSGAELRLPSTSGSVRVHHTSVAAHEWSSCSSIVVKAAPTTGLPRFVLNIIIVSAVLIAVDDLVLVGYTTPSVVPVTGAELVTLLTSALQPHRRTATWRAATASYGCAYHAGFVGDGTACGTTNECVTNDGGCYINAFCMNTNSSFS